MRRAWGALDSVKQLVDDVNCCREWAGFGTVVFRMAKASATHAPAAKTSGPRIRNLVTNRQALHDYHILETVEAGLALQGTEVKSIRAGNVNLRDAYARAEKGEIWLWNAHIAPFDQGNRWNHEPRRPRRLLLHTREIGRLATKAIESGNTLVPLRLYFKAQSAITLDSSRGRINAEALGAFMPDPHVVEGVEGLIRAGYLQKAQRDDIGSSVPRAIKERLDRVVGNKAHCPETPWWAFWR